jgi:hypothetical protein
MLLTCSILTTTKMPRQKCPTQLHSRNGNNMSKGLNKGQWKSSLYASNFVAVGSNKIKINYLSALDRLAYQGKKKKKKKPKAP